MKTPISWLDEWVPCADVAVDRLATLFVERGFPIESITRTGHGYEGIVVGRVLEVKKHPQADRLVLTRVDVGDGVERSIVCGAPNVVAGMRVPVALVGTVMPSGMEIRKSKIRGEVSEGMLCSGRELELSDDAGGILTAPDVPLGTPLREALGIKPETIIELEVHYNRPDVMSIAGVARELSAALGRPLREEVQKRLNATLATSPKGPVPITLDDKDGCPRYVGAVLRGVTIGPSPRWLTERLEQAGVRPLYNVVDVTNYVLLELGQPMHAFDLAKINEIRVRRATKGETLRTLDGRDRTLTPDHLVIADRDRAIALAGLMGGEATEVTSATKDILLESAYFDPYRVQVAANHFVLKTEAGRRFGRGVDPNLAPVAAKRAIDLLLELAGGKLEGIGEARARDFPPLTLSLAPERVNALLGAEIPKQEMVGHLQALGFDVRANGALSVTVPTYRRDVSEPTDLIEEIGRAHGYENLPDVPAGAGAAGVTRDPALVFARNLREILVGFGATEVLTPSLANPERLTLTWPLTQEGEPRFARLANPPSPEAGVMRTDLAAGLLDAVAHHLRHGAPGTRVFEVGHTFVGRDGKQFPTEATHVGLAIAGLADPESWEGERMVDFFDIKGLAEGVLGRLGIDSPQVRAYASPAWKAGEAAEVVAGGEKGRRIGWIGQVEPRRARAWKLDRPVFLFLASLDDLARASKASAAYRPFARFPAVKRDLAFFLPARVQSAAVEEKMRVAAGELLQTVRLFDVYRGKGVPEGQKSLAYSLLFAHPARTLAESEVEDAQAAIVAALAESFGATLRERTGAEER